MMMDFNAFASEDEEAMARAAGAKPQADDKMVEHYVSALTTAALDRHAFNTTLEGIRQDKALKIIDIIGIAERYRRGGSRLTTRKAALEAIEKRFLELVRQQAQREQAGRARPW